MSEAVDKAAGLLERRHGLRFDGSSHDRLRRALEAVGDDPDAVARRLATDPALAEEVLDRATLPETSWFRDPHVFARAVAHAAEAVRAAQAERRTATLWSAGCAHGQEPCSLAIGLLEQGLDAFTVVATDLAPSAVARAQAAVYDERELRGLDEGRRRRWLAPAAGGRFRVVDEVRDRVRVLRHGLAEGPPPMPTGSCELALCRNVLIYLEPAAAVRALEALRTALRPGGLLVLGGGESLIGKVEGLDVVPLGPPEAGFAFRREVAVRHPRAERRRTETPPGARRRRVGDPRRPATSPRRSVLAPPEDVGALLARGEHAAAAGDHAAAAAAFRHAAGLEPGRPLAHFGLGLALEAMDDPGAARAYRAAMTALERGGAAAVLDGLGGFRPEELARLIAGKLAALGEDGPA